MILARATFRAMNTDISLLAPEDLGGFGRAVATVAAIFADVEARLSRFRPDSELSALNRSDGEIFQASPLLLKALSLAVDAAEATSGVFEPSILPALEAAGYDRSFENVRAGTSVRTRPPRVRDYRSIRIDRVNGSITLEKGQRIDLGGIGKGLAVDLAIDATAFLPDRCINAGGDLAVRGRPAPDQEWTVDLEDPDNREVASVGLQDMALATSTVLKRRWRRGQVDLHHLIDPRTGEPSSSPFRTVTVVARTCVEADVAAKTSLLLGEEGLGFLERHGLHGMAVRRDGTVAATALWPRKTQQQ